jgi:hypothetical protein
MLFDVMLPSMLFRTKRTQDTTTRTQSDLKTGPVSFTNTSEKINPCGKEIHEKIFHIISHQGNVN